MTTHKLRAVHNLVVHFMIFYGAPLNGAPFNGAPLNAAAFASFNGRFSFSYLLATLRVARRQAGGLHELERALKGLGAHRASRDWASDRRETLRSIADNLSGRACKNSSQRRDHFQRWRNPCTLLDFCVRVPTHNA